MKLPAVRTLQMQDCYPAQADGGYSGDLHASLLSALRAWEKKRFPEPNGFKFGRAKGLFRKEKAVTATRGEISWNAAPEIKRAPCERKKRDRIEREKAVKRERTERERLSNKEKMRKRRESETPEERSIRLKAKRAAYAALRGNKYKAKRAKQTPEQRRQSMRDAKKRHLERVKAGTVQKRTEAKRKLTPEQLAAKAARQRKYYADFRKQLLTGARQA